MRIYIQQCKICIKKKKECSYYKDITEEGKNIFKGKHFKHNCPEYKKLFKPGDLVEIKVNHERRDGGYSDEYGDFISRWYPYENSPVRGRICGTQRNSVPCVTQNKYYQIRLFKEITLARIRNGREERIEFSFYSKVAEDIKLIHSNEDFEKTSRFRLIDIK